MLKIRDFAKLAEVSMTTLRYYDEIGLLKPIQVDPETGYRFYTMDQLPHLHRILALKELGLGLTQIVELLNEGLSPEIWQGMLRLRQAQLQQHIQTEQEQLVRIEARLRSLEQGRGLPIYEAVLKAIKPITGVSLRLTTTEMADQAYWIDPISSLLKRYGVTPIDPLLVLHSESEDEQTLGSVEIVAPVEGRDADALMTRSEGRLTRCELPAVPHYEVYDQEKHPALGLWPREAWESGLDLGGPREHRRMRYDDVFRVLTLPSSPRETALVDRNHGIQFHYLLYWDDVFASPGVVGTKVQLRFDPFDISHIYVYVHNHWVECVTSSYYGQLHGHSEREIMLASAELREQNRDSHVRTPIDAKRLADFLAKIEAHEAVLLQRQRDIENQVVVYHIEQNRLPSLEVPRSASMPSLRQSDATEQPASRFAPVDLTTLQVYEEFRRLGLHVVLLDEAQHMITSADGKQPKDQLNWIKSMATETGVLHVLIGTYDVLPFCNLDGQMARRGSEIHFARYHMEDENDCLAFRNAFSSLLKQIPLQVDHDALILRWWYFFSQMLRVLALRFGFSPLAPCHQEWE